ncbi:MAG TPA: hypothetical protein VIF43_00455 [Patescibacteria group bacterium]|jgi:hypothetical protein
MGKVSQSDVPREEPVFDEAAREAKERFYQHEQDFYAHLFRAANRTQSDWAGFDPELDASLELQWSAREARGRKLMLDIFSGDTELHGMALAGVDLKRRQLVAAGSAEEVTSDTVAFVRNRIEHYLRHASGDVFRLMCAVRDTLIEDDPDDPVRPAVERSDDIATRFASETLLDQSLERVTVLALHRQDYLMVKCNEQGRYVGYTKSVCVHADGLRTPDPSEIVGCPVAPHIRTLWKGGVEIFDECGQLDPETATPQRLFTPT